MAVIPIPGCSRCEAAHTAGLGWAGLVGMAGLGDIDPRWEIDTRFIRGINTLAGRGHQHPASSRDDTFTMH